MMVNRTSLRSGSTALTKNFKLHGLFDDANTDDWQTKTVKEWTTEHIMLWIHSVAQYHDLNYEKINMHRFNDVSGLMLDKMQAQEFQNRDSSFGEILYEALQEFKAHGGCKYLKKEVERPVKKRGRPRGPASSGLSKKKKSRCCLWQFLLDLLSQPEYCPSVITWENYDDGLFRMVQSERVAKLWGTTRGNVNMDYAKMTRLMRYYYSTDHLKQVKQRLVYKFGEKTFWKKHRRY